MRSTRSSSHRFYGLAFLLLAAACSMRAEELTAEDILPENTLAAFVIPDLAAARKQAGQTQLAEIFSQPEMQQFLQPVLAELRAQYEALRKKNPVLASVEDLDAALLSGEFAAALYTLPNQPRGLPGVCVTLRPKDMAALKRSLVPSFREILELGEPIALVPGGPFIALTKDRLIVTTLEADLPVLMARAAGGAPVAGILNKAPAFTAGKNAMPQAVARFYVAPDRLMNLVQALPMNAPGDGDRYRNLMLALGMGNTTAYFSALSFQNRLPVIEGSLRLKNESAEGLPALFVPPKSTSPAAESFAIASADAPYVAAGHFNVGQIIPLIRLCARAVSPAEAMRVDQQFQAITRQILRCDLQKDLLENIGPEFVAVQTPTDTSMPLSVLPGMVYSFALKDPPKLDEALKNFGAFLSNLPPQFSSQYGFKQIAIDGNAAYYVSGMLAPASPVMCLVKNRLMVGTSINALRRVLEQTKSPKNILSNPAFQAAIARVSGKPFDAAHLPTAFSFGIDESNGGGSLLLSGSYIATAAGATAALAEVPAQGQPAEIAPPGPNPVMDFLMRPAGRVLLPISAAVDLSLWPDETFFRKYRMATASCMSVEPNAVLWKTELPVPGPSGNGPSLMMFTSTSAIIAAIAIPSLLRSRMAANETAAAASCKAFAEAEEIYHRTDYDKDGVLEYAQTMQDLLQNPDGQEIALVDRAFAQAEAGRGRQPVPKAGYYFKVLKAQGEAAPGGKKSYLTKAGANENMTLGYAFVAYPAEYDSTGRDCFIISNTGTIYMADLGPRTAEMIEQMIDFDPAYGGVPWVPAE